MSREYECAASNPARASRLQSVRPVRPVAESFGGVAVMLGMEHHASRQGFCNPDWVQPLACRSRKKPPNGLVSLSLALGSAALAVTSFQTLQAAAWTCTGSMITPRYFHTATLLTNGQVLVAGGEDSSFEPTGSAELYDPATGIWTATGSLGTGRQMHTATLLPNGMVLVVGGWNHGLGYLSSAELYDPAAGIWRRTGPLVTGRSAHTATSLPGGKVLVAGGFNPTGGGLASTELYDLSTETWFPTGAMTERRINHTATLLEDGTVLVAAGFLGTWLEGTELYSPVTDRWTRLGSLTDAHEQHTATMLPGGKVLVVGGCGVGSNLVGALASVEVYDANLKHWSAGTLMDYPRSGHTATLLRSGKLLVVGGSRNGAVYLSSALLYDPSNGRWT